jgi:hypothetical protein
MYIKFGKHDISLEYFYGCHGFDGNKYFLLSINWDDEYNLDLIYTTEQDVLNFEKGLSDWIRLELSENQINKVKRCTTKYKFIKFIEENFPEVLL